jgi:hypothetical protein
MFQWLRRQPVAARADLLDAVVVRNAAVREQPGAAGVRLTAPLQAGARGWRRVFGGRGEKTFELDALGAFVWRGVDGRRTVEGHIRRFADEQRVNLREAEAAVTEFFKMLTRRGLVGVVVGGDGKGRAAAGGGGGGGGGRRRSRKMKRWARRRSNDK